MVLKDATVACVGVDRELGIGQPSREVGRVLAGHHPVVVAVGDEHCLRNAREICRLLDAPAVDSLEMGPERGDRDRLVSVLLPLLQPVQEGSRR